MSRFRFQISSPTCLLQALFFFFFFVFFCDFLECLGSFLFYPTPGFTFSPAFYFGGGGGHKVNLIRSRGAPVELKTPLFDPSKWMLHAFSCNPETVGDGLGGGGGGGVGGSAVVSCYGCKQRLSVFPPRSPLPL